MEYYSITQVARLLGITRQAVHYRIRKRLIIANKVGRTWIIPKSSITK